jgi:hypothetical protein
MTATLSPYLFHLAAAFAAWSIVTTLTAAWPAIVELAREVKESGL